MVRLCSLLREGIQEGYIRCLVRMLLTWLICRPSIKPVQCHDCFGKERGSYLHEGVHTGGCLWPRFQQACRKCNYNLQSCLFKTSYCLKQQNTTLVNKSVIQLAKTDNCGILYTVNCRFDCTRLKKVFPVWICKAFVHSLLLEPSRMLCTSNIKQLASVNSCTVPHLFWNFLAPIILNSLW